MSRYRKRSEVCIPYNMLGKDLSRVSSNPYLGVLFHEDMTLSFHIQGKAKDTLAFISRNLYGCLAVVKCKAYITYARPITEYPSSIWDPFTQTNTSGIGTSYLKAPVSPSETEVWQLTTSRNYHPRHITIGREDQWRG